MRLAALRRAVEANGFVRAKELAIPVDSRARDVGKLIFASPLMSINGNISCQSCHLDEFGSTDGLPVAVGVGAEGIGATRLASGGQIVPRNVLPFWGRGSKGFDTFFWDGKVGVDRGQLVSQFGTDAPSNDPFVVAVHLPSVELREMVDDTPQVEATLVDESVNSANLLQSKLAQRFAQDPVIGPRLAKAFGTGTDALTFNQVATSLGAFIRDEFKIRPTKLEHFVFDSGPLTKSELAGGILFYGRGKCVACHGGPYFSDMQFHAVAFPQMAFGKNGFGIDYGRYNVTFDPEDRFKFRTPPLFNVSKTAPYSHSGSVATIHDAIVAHFDPLRLMDARKMTVRQRADIYARLGPASREPLPSPLTDEEIGDLVSFLTTLNF
ncbi:methylamine utilization protein MauG [Novosphingobium profundi]|nr:methylamine utilization protein MauG [Novosphingobium profundi]